MSQPALTISGNNTPQNVEAPGEYLQINYGDLILPEPTGVTITAGGRSTDFFLSPNNFPILLDGDVINLQMRYGNELERMTVQRLDGNGEPDSEKALEAFEMSDYQKMIAFIYLVGVVTRGTDD